MNKIIIHWTAGLLVPNSVDLKHYHFLIDKLSDMISSALNNALHLEVTHYYQFIYTLLLV